MYQEDWLMKQIRYTILFITRLLFEKDSVAYKIRDIDLQTETDILYLRINNLVDDGLVNEAENLLFDSLDTGDDNHLLLALDFYTRLNEMSDDELEESGFSREEIESGLNEIKELFGVPV